MEQTTKERLLDTAERLFAAHGFDAVSIRQIVSDAVANLAAVHYHFKSKEALLDAVIMRRVGPVNDERLAMLDRLEAEAGERPVPVEQVLEAFLFPTFEVVAKSPHLVMLMARMFAEGVMARLMRTHFHHVFMRFQRAFHRSLPSLPEDELRSRIEYCIACMVAALNGAARQGIHLQKGEAVTGRLITFLAAGLRAPIYKASKR